jgi:hypothetical protein
VIGWDHNKYSHIHQCVNYNFDRYDSKNNFINFMMEKIECLKVLCFVDSNGDVCVKRKFNRYLNNYELYIVHQALASSLFFTGEKKRQAL